MNEELKNVLASAKNICIIPAQSDQSRTLTTVGESAAAALALFYTLKELGKNVNLLAGRFSEKLDLLVPSLDALTTPKNVVISVPKAAADISQVYYEKNDDQLKIHLTVERGQLKKEHISFYFEESKPDLVITLGIQNFQEALAGTLNSFGYLLDAPIVNIDNNLQNLKFGAHNVVEEKSLAELVLEIIGTQPGKNAANCLLAGLVMHYENFKSKKTGPEIFQLVSQLIKQGAQYDTIVDSIYQSTQKEIEFLGRILEHMRQENGIAVAAIASNDFLEFSETEASAAVEKIKTIGMRQDLLVLWQGKNSDPMVKGFFCSQKPQLINKFSENPHSYIKNGWVFLGIPGEDMAAAKTHILSII